MALDLVAVPAANLWDRTDVPDTDTIAMDLPADDLAELEAAARRLDLMTWRLCWTTSPATAPRTGRKAPDHPAIGAESDRKPLQPVAHDPVEHLRAFLIGQVTGVGHLDTDGTVDAVGQHPGISRRADPVVLTHDHERGDVYAAEVGRVIGLTE